MKNSMPLRVDMPMLSPTMKMGNIVAWYKKEGDYIEAGDVILDIDTDKATMEVEATCSGILEKIVMPAGTHDVPVRSVIAILRQNGDSDEDVARAISEVMSIPSEAQPVAQCDNQFSRITNVMVETDDQISGVNMSNSPAHASASAPLRHCTNCKEVCKTGSAATSLGGTSMMRISPLAKKMASEYSIDVTKIIGSGPGSRIVQADVKRILGQLRENEDSAMYIDTTPSRIRMIIAEKLTKSKRDIPHFYLSVTADVTDLMRMRGEINSSNIIETKITINDLIVKAVALALSKHQGVNVAWCNDKIRRFKNVDIAIAISVEDGLVTPVVEYADSKGLIEISSEIKSLTHLARTKSLTLRQITGGGITVSNLGMYGVNHFFAIINSNQGSILSIGKVNKVPVYKEHNELVAAHMLEIGYSVDHRVIDGAAAAAFLSSLVMYLQNPTSLLVS